LDFAGFSKHFSRGHRLFHQRLSACAVNLDKGAAFILGEHIENWNDRLPSLVEEEEQQDKALQYNSELEEQIGVLIGQVVGGAITIRAEPRSERNTPYQMGFSIWPSPHIGPWAKWAGTK